MRLSSTLKLSLVPVWLLASLSLSPFLCAQAAPDKVRVDSALVLAVDISYSMDTAEQRLQRAGYVAAIRSPEFLNAIRSGSTGRIAIEYIQWASHDDQDTLLRWTLISDAQSAMAAADRLAAAPYRRARRTSISGGIEAALRDLDASGYPASRRIIDVSGDGPNNDGPPVTLARDRALAEGVTINGLPLVGIRDYLGPADIPNLDAYYETCVIGGVDSFMIPIHSVNDFVAATRTKLVREIAWRTTRPDVRLIAAEPPVSCTIGEDRWRGR